MNLWVDYTNHAGIREWRPITIAGPIQVVSTSEFEPDHVPRPFMGMMVLMKDRDNMPRMLAVERIHGFYQGDEKPTMSQYVERHRAFLAGVEKS